MWTEVTIEDVRGADKCMEVMEQMDHVYGRLSSEWLRSLIAIERARVFLFERDADRVVLVFQFNPKLGLYRIYTGGITPLLSSQEASDLAVEQILAFMRRNDLEMVYAIRRKGLDYGPINEVFELVKSHPSLSVTVVHEMNDRDAWHIRASRRPTSITK
ncbi:hypothetical protein K2X85_01390 [bacterium]|nr:hypothetical protein [bacterium]